MIQLRDLPRVLRFPVGLAIIAALLPFCAPAPIGEVQSAWIQIIVLIVVIVLTELLRPEPNFENARPGGVGDFSFPTATEGRPVPLLWGRNKIAGPNVIWYGDIAALPILQRVQTGLWKSKKYVRGYTYHVGIQFGLCRGPDVELVKVFIEDDRAYQSTIVTSGNSFDIDLPNLFGGSIGAGGVRATCDFYGGSTTQAVSSYLDATDKQRVAGLSTIPRYTGTSYVVARNLTTNPSLNGTGGAEVGTSLSVRAWRFEAQRFPPIFDGQASGAHKIGDSDCNPINVMYEILTNTEWGLGFPASDLDIGAGSSFVTASDAMVTESNGFAMLLDRSTDALAILGELERHIDGYLFISPLTGKWTLKLARADYTLASLRAVNESNSSYTEFTRGSWEDTTNQIQVKYWNRADDYKEAHAIAQDMANMQIQGAGSVTTGRTVVARAVFPGIKTSAEAANAAWRMLREQSYPLARATLQLDRTFWDVVPGEVLRWTDATLGLEDLPVRVTAVDYGKPTDGRIEVGVVQDIFKFAAPSYGNPGSTNWTEPTLVVVAYPSTEQLAFEAPRALIVRDPEYAGNPNINKVATFARKQGAESEYAIMQRNAQSPTTPSGDFSNTGDVSGFVEIGKLKAALAAGTARPTATITIEADPDTKENLDAAFDDNTTVSDMGTNLVGLCMVGSEFMLVQSASINGSDVDLENVYRGVLDSAQQAHALGDRVYMLHSAFTLSETIFPVNHIVHIKLIPSSFNDTLAIGSATQIAFTTADRTQRPYLPSEVSLNGTRYDVDPSMEGAGSGLNGFKIEATWLRRRFDTVDEIDELSADQTVDASTEYEVEFRHDPAGTNDLIKTLAWATGTGPADLTRLEMLDAATNGAVGADYEVRIKSRHDHNGQTDLESTQTLTFTFTPTSGLTGQFALGKPTATNATNSYAVSGMTGSGTITVNIGASYASTTVDYRKNGGSWTTLITTGNTTGTTGVTFVNTDTIELRHSAAEGTENFIEMVINSPTTTVAYGLFKT